MHDFSPLSGGKATVIQDSREKLGHGYFYPEDLYFSGTIRRKLDTGDYSILGFENKITIDRKAKVSELATNLTQPRFKNEMIRMSKIDKAIVLLEFTEEQLDEWPYNAGLSSSQIKFVKTSPKFLRKKIHEFADAYGVSFIYAGDEGREITYNILLEALHDSKN